MDVFRSFIRDLNIGHVVKIGKQLEPHATKVRLRFPRNIKDS